VAEWMSHLVEFNLHVARFAHRSWFPRALSNVLWDSQGRMHPRAERKASDWLLRELSLQREMDWHMAEPQKRVWFLDEASLERLTYELALTMHRDGLAQVIDGARLRALHKKIDADAWRFIVEDTPEGLFRHRTPTVDFDNATPESLTASLRADGARTLLSLIQMPWRAVRDRARVRFDISLPDADGVTLGASRTDKALDLICTHLIPRRLPQWAWLF